MLSLRKRAVFIIDAQRELICYGVAEDAHKLSWFDQGYLDLQLRKSIRKANRFLKKNGLRPIRDVTDNDCEVYRDTKELPQGALLARCDLKHLVKK